MSNYFQWTKEEFGLDVPAMDSEHQELIDKMNALYDGVQEKKSFLELQKLVDDLAAYTVKHFADEEAYIEKIKFEGLATHKIIHQQLLKQFKEFVVEFNTKKALSDAFFSFLKVWLTSHIRGIDMKYAKGQAKAS